ncbi:uncharacterized protein EMH_0052360 [Eimeria mitis]|uniref:non-specific serine/threonine protein kinase n=1 Tax=Eimeria mitis TaxID=44415 RepID=U6K0B2_9EIME|nr:uncharacterized protein EMH_0052360 [Eimeria mitis]CDJ29752.1 hypothetical protein EMH_0052360 [Eimeria mitis]
MRLQADVLRYMTKGEFRVLTAVEMGMKNHEFVSAQLIEQIAGLRRHSIRQILSILLKNKLLYHCSKVYDGYKLTYLGYDYLALNALVKRGLVKGVGVRIGVGKESDIHLCEGADGAVLVLKLHRLEKGSLPLSRDGGLSVSPLRFLHVLLQQLSACMQVRELQDPLTVLEKLMKLVVRLAHCGLIHGDFNEFNLMISDNGRITMIDLPQMVSIYHPNAALYFDRDVQCIKRLFERKFLVDVTTVPRFEDVIDRRSRPPAEAKRAAGEPDEEAAEEGAEERESSVDLISISDGLSEQQVKLLESALAERREAESSGSEESDSETVSEGSDAAVFHEEETDEEKEISAAYQTEEKEKCEKREINGLSDSDEDHQQTRSSRGSDSSIYLT